MGFIMNAWVCYRGCDMSAINPVLAEFRVELAEIATRIAVIKEALKILEEQNNRLGEQNKVNAAVMQSTENNFR